jgi:hypothetical protein
MTVAILSPVDQVIEIRCGRWSEATRSIATAET